MKNIIFNENTLYEYVMEPIEQGFLVQFNNSLTEICVACF